MGQQIQYDIQEVSPHLKFRRNARKAMRGIYWGLGIGFAISLLGSGLLLSKSTPSFWITLVTFGLIFLAILVADWFANASYELDLLRQLTRKAGPFIKTEDFNQVTSVEIKLLSGQSGSGYSIFMHRHGKPYRFDSIAGYENAKNLANHLATRLKLNVLEDADTQLIKSDLYSFKQSPRQIGWNALIALGLSIYLPIKLLAISGFAALLGFLMGLGATIWLTVKWWRARSLANSIRSK